MLLMASLAILLSMMMVSAQAQELRRVVPETRGEVQHSFAPVVKKAAPAVVNIYTRRTVKTPGLSPLFRDPFFEQFFGGSLGMPGLPRERVVSSLGSGVIVRPDGLIVTSQHVIEGSEEITVVLSDRREFDAEIRVRDPKSDLALLKVDTEGEYLPFLELKDVDSLEVGDLVLAIGNPFGVGQTVTSGIISALARTSVGITDYQFFIQTDAAINPGNSGGALVSMDGRMVGVNTAIFSKSGGSHGIGFAIPATMVEAMIAGEKGGRVVRPWFGAKVQDLTTEMAESLGLPTPQGVLVTAVYEGSPASRSGLEPGDLIIALNDKPIGDAQSLRFRIATIKAGSSARITYVRGGEEYTRRLILVAPPEDPPRDEIRILGTASPLEGATVANLSPAVADELGLDLNERGVVILRVERGRPAARYGFEAGDILRSINGSEVVSTRQMARLFQRRSEYWRIVIERDGHEQNLVVSR